MDIQLIEPTRGAPAADDAGTTAGAETEPQQAESSWLCESANARERMLDMDERLAPVRALALGMLALVAISQAHWIGLWTLIPIVPAAAAFALARRRTTRTARPEYALFTAWVVSEVVIAATVAISGEPVLLSWLAIPVVTLSARFSLRGVIAGVTVAAGLMVAVASLALSQETFDYPPTLVMPLAVVLAVGILSTALMRSDVEHRDEAVIDQLTGMLNRHALARRAAELEQQSRVSGEPIAVVIGDIDRFKDLNDSLGHAVGDGVLRDIAYTIRTQLRAFDLAYRIGGEEFLVLIPGANAAQAAGLAERIRRSIAAEQFGGRELTMSFGVAATERGERFVYQSVFCGADAALYEAKRCGRDRVITGGSPTEAVAAAATEPISV